MPVFAIANRLAKRGLLTVAVAALAACAATPVFPNKGVNTQATPPQAVRDIGRLQGARVVWGGVIVSAKNLQDSTQLEVLDYPLDSAQRPDTSKAPRGRFLVVQSGYLETVDYAAGRQVTVLGNLQGTRTGSVGESTYVFPVVAAEGVHLWPKESETYYSSQPQFHFGIGVGVGIH